MRLKVKVIIGIIIALAVFVAIGYIGNIWGQKGVDKIKNELKAAQERINLLNGQATSLNFQWEKKELEYKTRIESLNIKINERQKEINGLKKKITDLEKQRAEIVIPQSPDLMCPEFIKIGFSSCTRASRRH